MIVSVDVSHGMQHDMRSKLILIALTLTPCANSLSNVVLCQCALNVHVVEYYEVYILISIMNEIFFYSKFK